MMRPNGIHLMIEMDCHLKVHLYLLPELVYSDFQFAEFMFIFHRYHILTGGNITVCSDHKSESECLLTELWSYVFGLALYFGLG